MDIKFCEIIPRWINVKLLLVFCILYLSSSQGQQDPMRVLCYFANWSEERNSSYRLYPWNIDSDLCTHIVYAFAMPDLSEGIVPLDFLDTLDSTEEDNEFVRLRRSNPDLKLLLSIGGWNEGSIRFSQIAADPGAVQWFAEYICQFIRKVKFDGLDMNWQWPGFRTGSNTADKINFAQWVKALRSYFELEGKQTNQTRLLVSVVLPPLEDLTTLGFDLDSLVRDSDFVNLHSMDYYVSTDAVVNHLAPLYAPRPDFDKKFTVDSTVNLYLSKGIDRNLINLGIPYYGTSFQLLNMESHEPLAPSDEEGTQGFGTGTPGMLAYFEICKYVNDERWTVNYFNRSAMGPYAYRDKNWVSYDDIDIVKKKVHYAMDQGLGGVTLWTIDMDDFNGLCKRRFPLTKAVREAIKEHSKRSIVMTNIISNNNPQPSREIQTPVPVTTETNTIPPIKVNRPQISQSDNTTPESIVSPLKNTFTVSKPAPPPRKKVPPFQTVISTTNTERRVEYPRIGWKFKTDGNFILKTRKYQHNINHYNQV